MDFDVIFVGAGPYGLSGTAYLKDKGFGVGTFGDPMSFWRDHMPAGMYLRSNWLASHISDPRRRLTLDPFRADIGAQFQFPIPLDRFVDTASLWTAGFGPRRMRRLLGWSARFEHPKRDIPALLFAVGTLFGPLRNARSPLIAKAQARFELHGSIINGF